MATKSNDWVPAKLAQLMRTPGTHKHPAYMGFTLEVSPKFKAVWRYKFRDCFGDVQEKKIADAGLLTKANQLDLEDALKKFEGIHDFHMSKALPGGLTLSKAYDDWCEKRIKKGGGKLSPMTVRDYDGVFNRYLRPEAGETLIDKATPTYWEDVLQKVRDKSVFQGRKAFALLRTLFNHYVDMETLVRNPVSKQHLRNTFAGKDSKKERKGQVKTVDIAMFIRGVYALRNPHSRDAILTAALTGWRRSGVMRMKWQQIDWKQRIYNVRPGDIGWKSFEGEMALNDYVLQLLQERRDAGGEIESRYVFPSRHGKKEYLQDVRTSLVNACAGMGYEIGLHDLRRTFATLAELILNNGRLVGWLIGHQQAAVLTVGKADDEEGTVMTGKYIVRNLKAERVSATRVAGIIIDLAMETLSEADTAFFAERGVDITHTLELVDLQDDDEESVEDTAMSAEETETA